MKEFFGGYQRKIAVLKQDGVMSIVEGKLPLSFKGYKFLSERAADQRLAESAFYIAGKYTGFCSLSVVTLNRKA